MNKKYTKYVVILFAIYIISLLYLTIFAPLYHRNTIDNLQIKNKELLK